VDEFSLDNPANFTYGKCNCLLPLSRDHPRFSEVKLLFKKEWQHRKKARPQVHFIFKVLWPAALLQPYLAYRDKTLQPGHSPGNEQLLFHGTNRACLLGEKGNSILCNLHECNLCSILRTSFDTSRAARCLMVLRFGYGIYTTSCSSKADDYIDNLSQDATFRVMIVSHVIVGRPFSLYSSVTDLHSPPNGYDSVRL
ncbi:hypothetical protein ID866_10501, partial [Astraeus odoratus]